jgi:hypothetical protein
MSSRHGAELRHLWGPARVAIRRSAGWDETQQIQPRRIAGIYRWGREDDLV